MSWPAKYALTWENLWPLFGYAFNASILRPVPPDAAAALAWITGASLPVTALDDPAVLRTVLGACARRIGGTPATATTTRRKRAVLANALGYAVELRILTSNSLDRIQCKAAAVVETVDRRSVANPVQIRALLAAVRDQGDRGQHMEAYSAASTTPRSAPPKPLPSPKPTGTCPPAAGAGSTCRHRRPRAGN